MVLVKLDQNMQKKKKKTVHHPLTPYTRIKSKWIKYLNVSCKTIKILKESIGSKVSDISCSNIFASKTCRTLETKEKINKCDYIKLKSFCTAKGTISNSIRELIV